MTQITNIVIDMRTVSSKEAALDNIFELSRRSTGKDVFRSAPFLCIDKDGDVMRYPSMLACTQSRWTGDLRLVTEQELANMCRRARLLSAYTGERNVCLRTTGLTTEQYTAAYNKLAAGQGVRRHEPLTTALQYRNQYPLLKVDECGDLFTGSSTTGYAELRFDLNSEETTTMNNRIALSDLNESNIRRTVVDLSGMPAEKVGLVYDALVRAGASEYESRDFVINNRSEYPMLSVDRDADIIGRAENSTVLGGYTPVTVDEPVAGTGLSTLAIVPRRTLIDCTGLTGQQVLKAYAYMVAHGVDVDEDEDDVCHYIMDNGFQYFGSDSCGDTMTFRSLPDGTFTVVVYDLGDGEAVEEEATAPALPHTFNILDVEMFRGEVIKDIVDDLHILGFHFPNEYAARLRLQAACESAVACYPICVKDGRIYFGAASDSRTVTVKEIKAAAASAQATGVQPAPQTDPDHLQLDLTGTDRTDIVKVVFRLRDRINVTEKDESFSRVLNYLLDDTFTVLRLSRTAEDTWSMRTFGKEKAARLCDEARDTCCEDIDQLLSKLD